MSRPFSGIAADIRGRLPFYKDDWLQGLRSKKALSATLFIFLTNMLPAITDGNLLAHRTGNLIGAVEVIVSMAIGGTLFAMISGQPLVVVGVTGPVTIFCTGLYGASVSLGLSFMGLLFWTCFWSSLLHLVLASLNLCRLFPKYATPFSGETFGFLIGVIYVQQGATQLADLFHDVEHDSALLSLLLGMANFVVATVLSQARIWPVFGKGARALIADYGCAASLVIFSAAQLLPKLNDVALPCLWVPERFEPSTIGRAWLDAVSISSVPSWGVFFALIPASILTALQFFDHNMSSLLTQRGHHGLKKPPSFDWDFTVLAASVLTTGLLGLPPHNGLIPQAPLHVRALAKIREVEVEVDGRPAKKEVWVRVCETRVSALGQSLLMFLLLSPPLLDLLRHVPRGVLAGLLLYLGVEGLRDNGFSARLLFLFMDRAGRGSVATPWATLPRLVVARFTLLQLLIVAVIFAVSQTKVGIAFPILIVLLVPLRLLVLPKLFSAHTLEALDPRHGLIAVPDDEGGPEADACDKDKAEEGGMHLQEDDVPGPEKLAKAMNVAPETRARGQSDVSL